MRTYGKIGSLRLLDIKVILNDNEIIYEGMVDDAPEEIKEMSYNEIRMESKITLCVNNSQNNNI